jgi:hypothetical protein
MLNDHQRITLDRAVNQCRNTGAVILADNLQQVINALALSEPAPVPKEQPSLAQIGEMLSDYTCIPWAAFESKWARYVDVSPFRSEMLEQIVDLARAATGVPR